MAIRVDNTIKEVNPGINSHSISDHTQSNWNGLIGEIFIKKSDRIFIKNVKIIPDLKKRVSKVEIEIVNITD